MRSPLLLLGLAFALGAAGCAAPVKLTGYPGPAAVSGDPEHCRLAGFQAVQVIGILPDEGTFLEVGYMTVGQSSTSELVYTSIEKQIEAARVRACEWGADAIVIAHSDGGKKNTWSAWSGMTYRDERESRVVAIRYVDAADESAAVASADAPDAAPAGSPAADERAGEDDEGSGAGPDAVSPPGSVIEFDTEVPGPVRIEIVGRGELPIRIFPVERMEAGHHTKSWDWRTDSGVEVRDGEYVYAVYRDEVAVASGVVAVDWPSP